MMKKIYFIDACAVQPGEIRELRKVLTKEDEVHIFGGELSNKQKAEVSAIESNVVLHVSNVLQRQRIDFELIALYAMYAAAEVHNRQLYVRSKSKQLLMTIDEMNVSCN